MKGNLSRLGIMAAAALMGSAASAKKEEVKEYSMTNLPRLNLLPTPRMTTPPDVFSRYYVGSTQWRNNNIKRKQLAKRSR